MLRRSLSGRSPSSRILGSVISIAAMAILINLAWAPAAQSAVVFQPGEITTTFLNPTLAGTNVAILRVPPANPNAHIGLFIMHSFSGYANFTACMALAQRGYTTLCAPTVPTLKPPTISPGLITIRRIPAP